MTARKILVPYNFSVNDEKAVAFVIDTYNTAQDVDITLFHTYVPVPNIEVSDKTVMARLSSNITYLRQKLYDLEKSLEGAADRLIRAGFPEDKVHYVFKARHKDPSQEIIDHAVQGNFDVIVLNHNPSKIKKFFTASISKRVSKAMVQKETYIVG